MAYTKNFAPRGPHTGVMHTGVDTEAEEEAVISPVARWEKILTVLAEHGEIPALTELQIHKEAWRLTRADARRAKLRAMASHYGEKQAPSPASQELDPEVILRLIGEARGIRVSAQALADLPHAQRYEPLVAKLHGIAQAAQAILDGLTKLR